MKGYIVDSDGSIGNWIACGVVLVWVAALIVMLFNRTISMSTLVTNITFVLIFLLYKLSEKI